MTTTKPQVTDFTKDVFGRYVCNGLDEALRSTDRSVKPDAKPFDVIILGGGTFGPVLAHQIFQRDAARQHRVLVLEAGPFVLPEHVQNLPMMGLGVPMPTSLADLRANGQASEPRAEVWGLAWHSNAKFPGLAYCIGGRSLYWGGWSPQLLDGEMPLARWPAQVVNDLKNGGFKQAGRQIGVNETNDFIHGPLHQALRGRLLGALQQGTIQKAVPLAELPVQVDAAPGLPAAELEALKLEAPLAVEASTRAGFFPFNKFSSLPLLTKASRSAQQESAGDDFRKRLMVVPQCHVVRLSHDGSRVTSIETNLGSIPVSEGTIVVIALGTIESTRLALSSFAGLPGADHMGKSLMAHLRSNLTIRIPRDALGVDPNLHDLQASALFVKGRHQHADGSFGHFHLQITACGLGPHGTDSEAELFKKIPDIELVPFLAQASDTHVIVTIRGIGEMEPDNQNSFIRLDPEVDEYGQPRAFVSLSTTPKDDAVWGAMDAMAQEVASALAGGRPFEVIAHIRDNLGSTHHECGTLRMGEDPALSVTDGDGRLRAVSNAYVAGPALFPTIGSPNPMLTGVALARRLASRLISQPQPASASSQVLFDGQSATNWRMTGRGGFMVQGGQLELLGGDELGLLWYDKPMPKNYSLKLEWRQFSLADNSGVFVRFPNPETKNYNNPAYVPVHFGYEIQIDELARPDGKDEHRTGAVYGEAAQTYNRHSARPPGWWNEFEIRVEDRKFRVWLNGQLVTTFTSTDPTRGPATPSFVGLQAYPGARVAFRNIRVHSLDAVQPVAVPTPLTA
jgi:choline dehydrogenase-like flavoprotein